MNILFLHTVAINKFSGGISRMTSVLSDGFKKKDIGIFYLSLNKSDEFEENQFFLPLPQSPNSELNRNYIVKFVTEKKIDVIINQSTSNSDLTDLSYCTKPYGVKIISVIHNSLLTPLKNFVELNRNRISDLGFSFILPIIKNRFFTFLLKNLYKYKYGRHYKVLLKESDRVLVVSDKNIDEFLSVVNLKKSNKVVAISNSFSLPEYKFIKNDKIKEILWVGTPDFSIKRIDLALRIWALIEVSHLDWSLTILGDSPSLQKAKDLANQLNLSAVNFIGRQNPNEYYKRASMLIMTSTTESFGLVLVEAMHFGVVPFVFDSFPASKDIIKNEKSGFLIKSFDINLYAKKIAELIEDSKKRYIISQNSITKSKDFNIDVIIKQWINLLNSL
jgi:glycosyltransferase involved in cell wall biosynthesis